VISKSHIHSNHDHFTMGSCQFHSKKETTMQRRTFVTAAAATLAAPMLSRPDIAQRAGAHRRGLSPGGGTDALARVVGQKLATMWNLSVVIENKGRCRRCDCGRLRQQAAR
jgi:hypothetical protein